MKRPIRLRGWDKVNHLMIRCTSLNSQSGDFNEGAELMQFTGITDKNGREIWEGDVVMWRNEPGYSMPDLKYVVEWAGGGFGIKPVPFRENDGGLVNHDDFEVIGNIYENPELLST